MKFIFETGKEIICNDKYIAKILRQDKRYKEVTTEKEVGKGKGKTEPKTTEKEVGKVGEKDAKVQE